jgi:acyl CoA:acetate/3-ketoacid CoA transferase beta subunit
LTGARVVDLIVTDLCVFTVDKERGGLTLIELAPDVTIETVRTRTKARFAGQRTVA